MSNGLVQTGHVKRQASLILRLLHFAAAGLQRSLGRAVVPVTCCGSSALKVVGRWTEAGRWALCPKEMGRFGCRAIDSLTVGNLDHLNVVHILSFFYSVIMAAMYHG